MRVPRGFRDILPTEARELQAIERTLIASFATYGYVPLEPPMVEFVESAATVEERRMLRFLDRDGGLVALRPDITTSVARVVAQRYAGSTSALRLSYFNAVFREESSMLGSEREYDQAGVELIGMAGLRADAEVIALLAEALAACGVRGADLDIGHVGYLGGYLSELDEAKRDHVAAAMRRGDLVAALAGSGLAPTKRQAVERGLRFRGGAASLAALRADAPAASVAAIDDLAHLAPLLESAGVKRFAFDLGFVPSLPYYSGIVFQVTAPELGFAIAAGGRYDGLLARFGADRPATGFGIAVPHLHQALVREGWTTPFSGRLVVLLPSADDAATLRVAAALRSASLNVAIDDVAEAAGQPIARVRVLSADKVEYEGTALSLDAFARELLAS